jgi:DNA-binding protein H-NS
MENVESAMSELDLKGMEFEELWLLHERLTDILSEKITAEKLELEKRLARLNPTQLVGQIDIKTRGKRRRYPKVRPKYFNPQSPTETWSGRGKKPRWVVAALRSGHQLEEFRIVADDAAGDYRRRDTRRS